MPTHEGHLYVNAIGNGNAIGKYLLEQTLGNYGTSGRGWDTKYGNEMHPASHTIGESKSHNNLPPYISVYLWKRTS